MYDKDDCKLVRKYVAKENHIRRNDFPDELFVVAKTANKNDRVRLRAAAGRLIGVAVGASERYTQILTDEARAQRDTCMLDMANRLMSQISGTIGHLDDSPESLAVACAVVTSTVRSLRILVDGAMAHATKPLVVCLCANDGR